MSAPGREMPHHAESLAERAESLRGVEALAGEPAATALAAQQDLPPGAPPPPPPSSGAPRAQPLGGHFAKGFAFMMAQSLATRIIGFAGQIALAWLLMPEHFGLIALANTVATFANLLQLIGVKEILVARQRKFHLWANPAFWITAVTGLATMAFMMIAAPIAAWFYGAQGTDLVGIMLILSLSLPLHALGVVPEAQVQSRLQFRFMAGVAATYATLVTLLTVALAALGFGAYSFVIPRVIAAAVRLAMLLRAADLPLRLSPQRGRWKYLISQSSIIFATSVLLTLTQIGDQITLGRLLSEKEVGFYFFAYSISLQTILMISFNLESVLFATLARLSSEPSRQLAAYLRASRVLAAIVVPLCLIQAAASEAAVFAVFGSKWQGSILAMQVLSVGMLFFGAYCPANAMLQAQKRFKTRLKLAVISVSTYFLLVVGGGLLGSVTALGSLTAIAIAVACYHAILSPIWAYVVVRPLGGSLSDAIRIVVRPIAAGTFAAGIGLALSLLVPITPWTAVDPLLSPLGIANASAWPWGWWARLIVIGAAGLAIYTLLMKMLMPNAYAEVAAKVRAIVNRLRALRPKAA